jgi:hypothetical protein
MAGDATPDRTRGPAGDCAGGFAVTEHQIEDVVFDFVTARFGHPISEALIQGLSASLTSALGAIAVVDARLDGSVLVEVVQRGRPKFDVEVRSVAL